jgi:hypothetical protein
MIDDSGSATATTWIAPPVTRDPFAASSGVAVDPGTDALAVDDPSATEDSVVDDTSPSTTALSLPEQPVDTRSLEEIIASRVPSTTTTLPSDTTLPSQTTLPSGGTGDPQITP